MSSVRASQQCNVTGFHYGTVPGFLPILCIVPPHMLRSILENGQQHQKAWALQTLVASERFRGLREASAFGVLALGMSVGQKHRTVYDGRGGTSLPGTMVRDEGDPATNDPAVDEAYERAGFTYDFYASVFKRNSIDDRGLRLESTVHYGQGYDNALWNTRQMVYGDGDGELFNRFTIALDVIGHELTHGVTQYEARLEYSDQPGALNESMSDVFGSLLKQWNSKQSAKDADWLIGQGLFTPNVHGTAIRSMRAPGTAYDDPVLGKDPQPAHMRDYRRVSEDNGGVHINSGIPNYAFYLAAIQLGGNAWEKAGQIWYAALIQKLRPQSDFQDAANATYQVAGQLYGAGSAEQQAVRTAWGEVGIAAS